MAVYDNGQSIRREECIYGRTEDGNTGINVLCVSDGVVEDMRERH